MRRFLATSTFLLLAVPATADDTGLETVVVTATRTPQPANKTGQSINVITAKDLETQQIVVVSDALQQIPGTMINRNGGVGQLTSISLRGADAGETVVMIDGVRINDLSATDDTALLGDVLVNNVDRMEILRGPQSTLYGTDAIGGVVNILTRRGGNSPFALTASAEGGAFDTYHLNVATSGTEDIVEYGAAFNWFGTRGISAADTRNGNPEPDGYKNIGASANVRIHATDTISVDLRGYYTLGHADFDDNFKFSPPSSFIVADSGANNRQELFAGYAGVNVDLFDGLLHNRAAVIATSANRRYFDSAFDIINLNSDDFSDVLRVEYQGTINPTPEDEITFGAETEHDQFRGDSFSSFPPTIDTNRGRARTTGAYAQLQHSFFEQLTVTGGLRYEHADVFGSHTSYKFAVAWQVPNTGATLRANFGDGFKAPSLFQRFSEFSPPSGKPALNPETAKGWEVGADKSLFNARLIASFTYFERRTHNLIDFVSCPLNDQQCLQQRPFGFYTNIGQTRTSGVEAELTALVTDEIKFNANYTNLSAIDLTANPTEPLQRRPHCKANATLTWSPDKDLSAGVSATYVGSRFDDGQGPRAHLSDYLLVNLFGSWALSDQYDVYARVENLFDRHYEPEAGYGAPGRAVFAGLRARI